MDVDCLKVVILSQFMFSLILCVVDLYKSGQMQLLAFLNSLSPETTNKPDGFSRLWIWFKSGKVSLIICSTFYILRQLGNLARHRWGTVGAQNWKLPGTVGAKSGHRWGIKILVAQLGTNTIVMNFPGSGSQMMKSQIWTKEGESLFSKLRAKESNTGRKT